MYSNKIKATAMSVLFFAAVLAGCSDYNGPVGSSNKAGTEGNTVIPEFRDALDLEDISFELEFVLEGLSRYEIKAEEIGASYITSVTLADGSKNSESADFSEKVSLQTNHPEEVDYPSCSTGPIKSQKVTLTNKGKERVHVTAKVQAKLQYGIVNSDSPDWTKNASNMPGNAQYDYEQCLFTLFHFLPGVTVKFEAYKDYLISSFYFFYETGNPNEVADFCHELTFEADGNEVAPTGRCRYLKLSAKTVRITNNGKRTLKPVIGLCSTTRQ